MKNFLSRMAVACVGVMYTFSALAQDGQRLGGKYEFAEQANDDMTPHKKMEIVNMLKSSETILRRQGKLADVKSNPSNARTSVATTTFIWPIKQAVGYSDNGFYGISNYVDNNAALNQVMDYNCGNRTYDQSNGYNHAGTDIFTWPFGWQKMNENAVEAIAGASGIILAKSNGNSDQNCAFCTTACDWNAVYIIHADGTVAWYGHLKNNSLTTKAVGEAVAAGEYLGIVGSSGNSTGPHLHFELYTNSSYTQLIDPWAGPCNAHGYPDNNTSWWAAQQNYRVPTLNKLLISGSVPQLGQCAANEQAYEKVNFVRGQNITFTSYYRDVLAGQTASCVVKRPNGSVWKSWTESFGSTSNAWWTGMQYTLTNNASDVPNGTWTYQVTYNGTTQTKNFAVGTTLPFTITNWSANKQGTAVALQLNTNNEASISKVNFQRSTNGSSYTQIATFNGKNQINNIYTYTHTAPGTNNYYRAEIVTTSGSKTYSAVKQVTFTANKTSRLAVLGNPFKNSLTVSIATPVRGQLLQLVSTSGVTVYSKAVPTVATQVVIETASLPSGIYQLILKDAEGNIERKTVVK